MEIVMVVALTPQQASEYPRTLCQTGLQDMDSWLTRAATALRQGGQEWYAVEKEKHKQSTRQTKKTQTVP